MFRKPLMTLTVLVTFPAMASAWYVNAKTSTTGQGSISPSGNTYYASGVDSSEYTVSPAAGYSVSRVTLDGASLAPNGNGKYVAPYASTKSWRYLVAYFSAASYSITPSSSPAGAGVIREDTFESLSGIPSGANRQLLVIPNPGYSVASVTAPGSTSTTDNADGSKTVVFNNITSNKSISATFALIPVVTAEAGNAITINGQGLTGTLYGSATSNQGSIAYLWEGAGLTFATPNAATTTVSAATPGNYTATLTVTSGSSTATDTVQVNVISKSAADEAQCANCHTSATPKYDLSLHKASLGTTVSCQTCHDPSYTGHHSQDPLNACQTCHSEAGEFYGSAHWQNHLETGDEFARQMNVAVSGSTVAWDGTYLEGILNANDSYTTTENGGVVTCAYRCHFRPGMFPSSVIPPSNYFDTATKRAKTYVSFTAPDSTVYSRPGGDSCVACHNEHQPEGATARSTCYTCHTGGNHGWSVRAFEKSSHFTGAHAEMYYQMNTKACIVCHNSHSLEASFGENSTTGCQSCHRVGSAYGIYSSNMVVKAPHGGGAFGGAAQYISQGAQCADCHSHNNTINGQYAESAHGDVNGVAWPTSSSHDWPTASGGACNPCHTTKGFINKANAAVPGYVPLTMEANAAGQTLACNACHDNTDKGTVRTVPQVVAGYKSQTLSGGVWTLGNATFPMIKKADGTTDTTSSNKNNTCVSCHSGRESGESIKAMADSSMNNVSFKNPHYLGAAGMMYAKLAYNFAAQTDLVPGSTSTYGATLTANEDGGALTSTHRKLGTAAINGDSHNASFFVAGNLDAGGPCVVCHMGGKAAGVTAADHTWGIEQTALDKVCSKCHASEAADLAGLKLFIEEQALPFKDAIALAEAKLLQNFKISYSDAYPYFYDNNLVPAGAVKDWTRGGTLTAAQAKNLMGACLNIKLMKADPAAYVHARTYARRVLYDTIDWLDDKTLNLSVTATAVAWDPVKYVIGADANAPSTESILYLKGYNRTSKAWNASERP